MVKVSLFMIVLCGVALPARAIGFISSSLLLTQEQDVQLSGQPQKDAVSGTGQLPPGLTPPQAIYVPNPAYSEPAQNAKVPATTIVSVMVGVDGKPSHVHVVRSATKGLDQKLQPAARDLDKKAVEAVQQYRFKPATFKGKPVAVEIQIAVAFRVHN